MLDLVVVKCIDVERYPFTFHSEDKALYKRSGICIKECPFVSKFKKIPDFQKFFFHLRLI